MDVTETAMRACQGCLEPIEEGDIDLWVMVKRARMAFCCVDCLAVWLVTKIGRECMVCQGVGAKIRKKRRIDYWMRTTGRTHP